MEPLGRVAVAPHRAQEQAFSGQHPDVFLFKVGHHEPPQGNVLHAVPHHGHEYGVTAFKADGLPGQLVGGQGAAGTQRAAGACQQMAFGVEQGQAVDGVAHRFQQHLYQGVHAALQNLFRGGTGGIGAHLKVTVRQLLA